MLNKKIYNLQLRKLYMKSIMPHLWFDKEAKEAATFYTSIFENSKITGITTISGTPSGECDIVSFELADQQFVAISAGPIFKFNPSISFQIKCSSIEEIETIWKKLSQKGNVLMELQAYPFSKKFGWLSDKFGLSWQLILDEEQKAKQKIVPFLMFVGPNYAKAEEAIKYYSSIFPNSKTNFIKKYEKTEGTDKKGTIKQASVTIFNREFGFMDSGYDHKFNFNEAISLIIPCESQKEIDYFWNKLSSVAEAEQCGWLKDKYGVSWQVWPTILGEMLSKGTPEQVVRVTASFMQMKKFDIEALKKAFKGEIMNKMNPVVHFELPAEDRKRMMEFYKKSFGWEMNQLGEEMGNYVVVMTSESDQNGPKQKGMINGGFYQKVKEMGAVYPSFVIAVDDVDEHMKVVKKAGGKIIGQPMDIPGVGKYVSFVDTEGNKLSMLQPLMNTAEKK